MIDDDTAALSHEELRRRLHEAEDTLRAIRDGEADAVVMRDAHADRVFVLGGSDESYRAIMEAMDIGAIALDGSGAPLYANGALCELLACDAGDLQTRGLWPYLDPSCGALLRQTMARSASGPRRAEMALRIGGRMRNIAIHVAPLPLSFDVGSVVTFTDISAQIEADRANESDRIARAVISSANEAVVVCDRGGKVINANAAAAALIGAEPMGRQFEDAFPLVFPVTSPILFPDDLVRMAIEGNAAQGLEAQVPQLGSWKDILVSAAPLLLAGERVGGCVVTLVDNSERKAIEKQQTLLLRELDHRVKNSLAVVMSIASRTSAHSVDLADFRTRFNSRLQAIAATHVLLSESAWNGVKLFAIIQRELAAFTSSAGPKLIVEGADYDVTPDMGIAFGLVIHELTTNAVKYGALSETTGSVSIVSEQLDERLVRVIWREQGGPAVVPPTRHGFGQTLISRSLNRGNGGGAELDYRPEGVICTITLPTA